MKYLKEGIIILLNSGLFFLNFLFLNRIFANLEFNKNIFFDLISFLILFSLFLSFYFISALVIDLIFLQINVVLIFLIYIVSFNKLILFNNKIMLILAICLILISIFEVRVKNLSKALVKIDLNKIYYFSQHYLFYFLIIMLGSFTYFRIETLSDQQKENIVHNAEEEAQTITTAVLTKSFGIKAEDNYFQAISAIMEKYYRHKTSVYEVIAIKTSIETQFSIVISPSDTAQDVISKIVSNLLASSKTKFLNALSFAIAGLLGSLMFILRPFSRIIDLALTNILFHLARGLQIIKLNYSDIKKESISI